MMTMTSTEIGALNQSVTLYFKQGGSDKVYHATLEAKDGGYVVNFAYGRRDSTLTTGTKTSQPAKYETAKKVYDKLVKEKQAKGYTAGQDGTPYRHTPKESRSTGVLPQLLNAIDESQAEKYLTNDAWWMQEKFDGKRVLIRKDGNQVAGINRNGLVIDLPSSIEDAIGKLDTKACLLDGECVGEVYHAFDLLEEASLNLREQPYHERYDFLVNLIDTCAANELRYADVAVSTGAKQAMLERLRGQQKEGVVFKHKDAPYTVGRPASGGPQLKLKFYATASCIVAGTNGSKRSVMLDLIEDDDTNRVHVGNVTIPPNQPIPKKGQVLEVRYLYAYSGGSLYQPTCLGVRDDIDTGACTVNQLKFKATSGEDDNEG